jgi:hypothetical protein
VRSLTPFVRNTFQSSEDESNDESDLQMTYDELCKESIKLLKFYKISLKKLKDVEHEKDSLVTILSTSHLHTHYIAYDLCTYEYFQTHNTPN